MALAYQTPVELVQGKLRDRHDRIALAKLHHRLLREPRNLKNWHDASCDLDRTLNGMIGVTKFFAYVESDLVGYVLAASITLSEYALYYEGFQAGRIDHIIPFNAHTIPYLGVHPEYQRAGLGTQLLGAAVEDAQQRNVPSLYALCWKGEVGASFRLFAGMGFEKLITFKGLYADGSLATLVVKDLA